MCPELISGFGTMTASATFLCIETNTATNFENSITPETEHAGYLQHNLQLDH